MVDIAIITAKAEEYKAVYDLLESPQLWPGTAQEPRLYSWTQGIVRKRDDDKVYRVVLAVTQEQGNVSAALAVEKTVRQFAPRYTVFVGIAGSLYKRVTHGDVVVANYVWGYEYGRIEETGAFQPRHLFTEATDTALKTSAATFDQVNPGWREAVGFKPGQENAYPTVEFGGIASGEKVIESVTGEFAQAVLNADRDLTAVEMEAYGTAQAIRLLRETRPIGLMVVRGISDMPIGVAEPPTQEIPTETMQPEKRNAFSAVKLSGEQTRQLQQALLSACPNEGTLRMFVRTGLEENLDAIVGGMNLSEMVFNLIVWAESRGRLKDLIEKAYQENPLNPSLRSFAASQFGGQTEQLPLSAGRTETNQNMRRQWTAYAAKAAAVFTVSFIQSHFPFEPSAGMEIGITDVAPPPQIAQTDLETERASLQIPRSTAQAETWEMPGGTLSPESPYYVERDLDRVVCTLLQQPGVTLTIKGARQMGKSSLLLRALRTAEVVEKRYVSLDFSLFDAAALADRERFFRQFCVRLTRTLKLENRLDAYWDPDLSLAERCTEYMSLYVLETLETPLVLAMDEVETIQTTEFRNEFFTMLRFWHNSRADKSMPVWRRLDLVIVTSTEPYLLITNVNQSPFNVGETVELEDFDAGQMTVLNRMHHSPLDAHQEAELFFLLHGHPYLTRLAFYLLVTGQITVAELFATAASDNGPFREHLRYHLFQLQTNMDLVKGMQQILTGRGLPNAQILFRLQSAGLIYRESDGVSPRCRIYADYFGRYL